MPVYTDRQIEEFLGKQEITEQLYRYCRAMDRIDNDQVRQRRHRSGTSSREATGLLTPFVARQFTNIPPKSNRRSKPYFSTWLYRERDQIERFFSKLKHLRRALTRYDKLA